MHRTHFLSKDLDKVANYKNYSNTLTRVKWTCKSSYCKQQFELNEINLKKYVEVNCYHYKRETPKGHTVLAKLHINGKTYTDQHDIVNQFNE